MIAELSLVLFALGVPIYIIRQRAKWRR